MVKKAFSREAIIIGEDGLNKLNSSHVIVFGIGGVGSYVTEALARAGIGKLTIVDGDVVQESNINRQLYALHSTIGMDKTEVAYARIKDINPDCEVVAKKMFFDKATASEFDFKAYDYIADAIDCVPSKILIAELADKCGTPVISAMGAGNKKNPLAFEVADISKTYACPLAKVVRRELKLRGIKKLKAVFSKEEAIGAEDAPQENGKKIVGSLSYVPSVMGLIIAGEIIKDLLL